jgi:hypothetical protein
MYEADAGDLIDFAKRWAALGEAVSEQVEQVVDDPNCGSMWNEGTENGVNPAAIRMAKERLGGLNQGIDQALEEFLETHSE